MADRSTTTPRGIVEDVLVRVGEFIFPADFVVLDMQEDKKVRPFLATGGAMIDVQKGDLTLQLHNEKLEFLPERIPQKGNAFLPLRNPEEEEERKKALGKPRGPPKVELKPLPEHLSY
ncbi:uncharacterized protein LOC121800293 isoform X2 [Salvia splendens]|uniref:uncharacterized protein LOC121800293 isoform X2 n=1 Tax=Salvia splendens TaxID=180675 RepID=UPI001C26F94A|nr:uncharacterized protein LOC121800293 isoform X2 [Salvia splendens]